VFTEDETESLAVSEYDPGDGKGFEAHGRATSNVATGFVVPTAARPIVKLAAGTSVPAPAETGCRRDS